MSEPVGKLPPREYSAVKGLDQAFRDLVVEARETYNLIEDLKAKYEQDRATIRAALVAAGVDGVFVTVTPGKQDSLRIRVTQTAGSKPRRQLSIEKLLKNDVPQAAIDASYVVGEPGEPGITITVLDPTEQIAA